MPRAVNIQRAKPVLRVLVAHNNNLIALPIAAAWREARIVEDFVLHGVRQFLAGIIARRECRAHNVIEFHGWLPKSIYWI
ncbi:MAG: hypothetical protein VX107_02795 [Pseudomonadota bacterium]|nr:hypothetical protein [Pseudomonadota bacterium]